MLSRRTIEILAAVLAIGPLGGGVVCGEGSSVDEAAPADAGRAVEVSSDAADGSVVGDPEATVGPVLTETDEDGDFSALGPWARELVKLARAGLDESVLCRFIDNTEGTYNLGSRSIGLLTALGVPNSVVIFALNHDQDIRSGKRPLLGSTVPSLPLGSRPLARLSSAAPAVAVSPRKPAPERNSILAPLDHQEEQRAANLVSWCGHEEFQEFSFGQTEFPGEVRSDRTPVPVTSATPLTTPILVYRAAPKVPNVIVIQPFP